MDSTFVLRFLLSNAILAVFLGGVILAKHSLRKTITTPGQYRISLVALACCVAPFLPVQYAGFESLWRWLRQLGTGSAEASGTAGAAHAAQTAAQGGTWLQDFAVGLNPAPQSTLYNVLGVILLVGAAVMLLALLINNWRLHQIKKTLGPIENEKTLQVFRQCVVEVGVRRKVRLAYSPLVKTPLTFGLLQPYVVMPSGISKGDAGEIRCAMLHELYHCKRGDMLANYMVAALRIVYWFNPVVWLFLKNVKREIELACDHSVLQLLGDDDGVVMYGETVLGYASVRRRTNDLVLASELSGSFKQLKERIGNIAGYEADTKRKKAKSLLALACAAVITLLCIPSFSAYAANGDTYMLSGEQITSVDYSDLFEGYIGAFTLYDPQTSEYMLYNEAEAVTRYTPHSTYKIYSALMALEDGAINPGETNIPWNGEQQPYAEWNSDHDLHSAMANSVSWYFQQLDARAGLNRLRRFYSEIGYGNGKVGNANTFWSDGSLRISVIEQVQMLERFYNNTFGFAAENVQAVKDAIFLEMSGGVRLFGKTGTGSVPGVSNADGWYIGYIEAAGRVYYFATHIQGEGASGSSAARITLEILNREGIYSR